MPNNRPRFPVRCFWGGSHRVAYSALFRSRGHTKWLRREIEAFEAQRQTAVDLYGRLDRCLIDYMLSAEGNAFTQDYFNAADGYYRDLAKTLAEDLPSEFHIPYTFENQARIDAILDQRYAEWSSGRPSS